MSYSSEVGSDGAPRGRVLVVDDEPVSRLVVGKILQKAGFDVLEVESGREALEVFRADAVGFDLVILDFVMPGLAGDEVFRALRQERELLPVLLVSGLQASEVVPKFGAAALLSYLKKPVPPDILIQATVELLQATQTLARLKSSGEQEL